MDSNNPNNLKVHAYCGYNYEVPDKAFKLSFATSFDSNTKYNYSNAFLFKVKDCEVNLSTDEVLDLVGHLRDMIAIGERIPNKDNTFGNFPS